MRHNTVFKLNVNYMEVLILSIGMFIETKKNVQIE